MRMRRCLRLSGDATIGTVTLVRQMRGISLAAAIIIASSA